MNHAKNCAEKCHSEPEINGFNFLQLVLCGNSLCTENSILGKIGFSLFLISIYVSESIWYIVC